MKEKLFAKGKALFRPLLLGAVAGFVNGLIGTGGGVILLLFSRGEGGRPGSRFGSTVAITAVFSLLSLFLYSRNDPLLWENAKVFLLPALAGGILGAHLLGRLPKKALGDLFAALTFLGGVLMLTSA